MPYLTVDTAQELVNQYKPKIQDKFGILLEEITVDSLDNYDVNRQRSHNELYPLFIEMAIPLHNFLFRRITKTIATSRKVIYVNEDNADFMSEEQVHFMVMWAMMNRLRDRLNFGLQEDLPKDWKSFAQKFDFSLNCIIGGFPIYMATDLATDIYRLNQVSAEDSWMEGSMAKIFYDSLNHKPQMEKFLEAKKVNFHSEGNLEPYAVGYRFFCSVYDHTRSIDKIFKIVRHPDISREEIRDPGIYLARI